VALPAHSGPWPLIHFHNQFSQTVGLLGREISSSQGLYLTQDNTNTEKTHTHLTSMPYVGFEATIPASERAKKAHALDRAVTVTGVYKLCIIYYRMHFKKFKLTESKRPEIICLLSVAEEFFNLTFQRHSTSSNNRTSSVSTRTIFSLAELFSVVAKIKLVNSSVSNMWPLVTRQSISGTSRTNRGLLSI
jgi:hypothetical protein